LVIDSYFIIIFYSDPSKRDSSLVPDSRPVNNFVPLSKGVIISDFR